MPENITASVATTTSSTQEGISLTVTPSISTQTVGNFVSDVSLQPYIRNRIISFVATNLRPNHQVYVHFDSINVSQYCAPALIPATGADTSNYLSVPKNGNWGDPLYTDSLGRIAVQFNIPANTFKTGDRTIEINNVQNMVTGKYSITMMAQAVYTASNLSVTKTPLTLTTVNPIIGTQKISSPPIEIGRAHV